MKNFPEFLLSWDQMRIKSVKIHHHKNKFHGAERVRDTLWMSQFFFAPPNEFLKLISSFFFFIYNRAEIFKSTTCDSWKCAVCKYSVNPEICVACYACGVKRNITINQQPKNKWICSRCTFQNTNSATYCAA